MVSYNSLSGSELTNSKSNFHMFCVECNAKLLVHVHVQGK